MDIIAVAIGIRDSDSLFCILNLLHMVSVPTLRCFASFRSCNTVLIAPGQIDDTHTRLQHLTPCPSAGSTTYPTYRTDCRVAVKLRRADLSVVIADELGPGDTFGEACMLDERRLLRRSSSHPHALNCDVNQEGRGDGSG